MAKPFSLLATMLAALVFASAAIAAGGSAAEGYGGPGGQVQTQVQGSLGQTGSGTLPFTGLDLGLLVVGGIALILVGGAIRRLGARA